MVVARKDYRIDYGTVRSTECKRPFRKDLKFHTKSPKRIASTVNIVNCGVKN